MGYMKVINADKAPKVVGPYSQAIETNNMLFCAGQIGIDPQSGKLVDSLAQQTNQVFSNIRAVLEKAGYTLGDVVKTTVFLQNMADYQEVNSIYETYFKDHKPARSAVAVAALPAGALIEIEVIACKD